MNAVWKTLAGIGVALMIGGLLLGSRSLEVDGVACGSAFSGSDAPRIFDTIQAAGGQASTMQQDCADRRADFQPATWALIILGGALVVGGLVLRSQTPDPSRDVQPSS